LNFGRDEQDILQQDGMMKTGLTGFFFGKRKRKRGQRGWAERMKFEGDWTWRA
jgi:hypothetical protein